MIVKVEGVSGQELAKRFFWLAYQASSVFGMGAMQAVDNATEESVWDRIDNSGDYMFRRHSPESGEVYADYCFGRMMKFGLKYRDDSVEVNERTALDPEYQSWCHTYKTVEALMDAVRSSFAAQPQAA